MASKSGTAKVHHGESIDGRDVSLRHHPIAKGFEIVWSDEHALKENGFCQVAKVRIDETECSEVFSSGLSDVISGAVGGRSDSADDL
jgi:hypothetical protein